MNRSIAVHTRVLSAALVAAACAAEGSEGAAAAASEHVQSAYLFVDPAMIQEIQGGAQFVAQDGSYVVNGQTKHAVDLDGQTLGWCTYIPCLGSAVAPAAPRALEQDAFEVLRDYSLQGDGSFVDPTTADHVWLAAGWCMRIPCVEVVPY